MTTASRPAPVPEAPLENGLGDRLEDRLTRGYLHQVDLVRLLTFASVIAVHSVANTTDWQDARARGTLMLLHFTRETFFVITGFVLFHSGYPRQGEPLDLPRFWRRRFLLIGVPYVVWSLVYWGWHRGSLHDLAVQLITGTAEYHLYFLLVSMQVYLVFGLLVALVRVTTGHHAALLAGAAAGQLVLFWFLHDALPSWHTAPGWVTTPALYAQQLLPSYLAYVLAGALAAVHLRRVQVWVLTHGRLIAGLVVGGALVTETCYVWQVVTGTWPYRASDVLQPAMMPWTVIVTVALFWLGLAYARRRGGGLASRAVREGARISFGVFLIHPLVIWQLVSPSRLAPVLGWLGQPWRAAAVWLVTVAVSVAVVELFVRTPLSLPLTGRRWSGRRGRAPRERSAPRGTPPADAVASTAETTQGATHD